ncbi:MAG TPA: hypothetical protein VHA13_02230 [Gammaproteobacteria bacterium]|nr:hypothetical protein [Gammaproteobacteria bacterium]
MQSQTILVSQSDPLRDEILTTVHHATKDFAETIPENNFWALSAYTIIIPQLLRECSRYTLPNANEIGLSLNYIEAACQGITGLDQLMDKTTHRPQTTRTKGIINLASASTVIALSAIGAAGGPFGFALGLGVSFVLSIDDLTRQMRRWYNSEYFLVDNITALDKLEEIIKTKQKELEELKLALPIPEKRNKIEKAAWELKKSTINSLLSSKEKLQQQIEVKVDISRYENQGPEQISSLHEIIKGYKGSKTVECKVFLEHLQSKPLLEAEAYQLAKKQDLAIKAECKEATKQAVSNSILWALAFTGMLLISIPGGQIAGIAIIAAVSVVYLAKNSKKIVENAQHTARFFNKLKDPPESKSIPTKPNAHL